MFIQSKDMFQILKKSEKACFEENQEN